MVRKRGSQLVKHGRTNCRLMIVEVAWECEKSNTPMNSIMPHPVRHGEFQKKGKAMKPWVGSTKGNHRK